jgi:O-acetyl-ADP-ribose deacetylase (regulator of RNase III)
VGEQQISSQSTDLPVFFDIDNKKYYQVDSKKSSDFESAIKIDSNLTKIYQFFHEKMGDTLGTFFDIQEIKINDTIFYIRRSSIPAFDSGLFKEINCHGSVAKVKTHAGFRNSPKQAVLQTKPRTPPAVPSNQLSRTFASKRNEATSSATQINDENKNVKVTVIKGNLTKIPLPDGLSPQKIGKVNAANRTLKGEGTSGTNIALFKKCKSTWRSSRRILQNKFGFKTLKHGEAVRTVQQDGSHILHARGGEPSLFRTDAESVTHVYSATYNALLLAKKNKLEIVYMPELSTGEYSTGKDWDEKANKAQMQAIEQFIKIHPKSGIKEVQIVIFDPDQAILDDVIDRAGVKDINYSALSTKDKNRLKNAFTNCNNSKVTSEFYGKLNVDGKKQLVGALSNDQKLELSNTLRDNLDSIVPKLISEPSVDGFQKAVNELKNFNKEMILIYGIDNKEFPQQIINDYLEKIFSPFENNILNSMEDLNIDENFNNNLEQIGKKMTIMAQLKKLAPPGKLEGKSLNIRSQHQELLEKYIEYESLKIAIEEYDVSDDIKPAEKLLGEETNDIEKLNSELQKINALISKLKVGAKQVKGVKASKFINAQSTQLQEMKRKIQNHKLAVQVLKGDQNTISKISEDTGFSVEQLMGVKEEGFDAIINLFNNPPLWESKIGITEPEYNLIMNFVNKEFAKGIGGEQHYTRNESKMPYSLILEAGPPKKVHILTKKKGWRLGDKGLLGVGAEKKVYKKIVLNLDENSQVYEADVTIPEGKNIKQVEGELELQMSLANEFIAPAGSIQVEYIHEGVQKMHISQPLLGPSLKDIEKKSTKEVARLYCGASKGLAFLHEKSYIHRDIKPANIFTQDTQNDGEETVTKAVIGDFGGCIDLDNRDMTDNFSGSLPFRAPEDEFSKASDVWAMGISIWQTMYATEERPFPQFVIDQLNKNRLNQETVDNGPFVDTQETNDPAELAMQRIIKSCLKFNPNERITAEDLAMQLEQFGQNK